MPDRIINIVVVHMIPSFLKYPRELFFVEKPPVEMVENAWFMASNQLMPKNFKNNISTKVSMQYMIHNLIAVSLIFGVSFSSWIPVASALNKDKEPVGFIIDKSPTPSTMTPSPPSQCIRLL